MASAIRVPCARASSSLDWLRYFESNLDEPELPWRDPYRMTPAERDAVAASIQQFQLGESGDGRRLLRHAERVARKLGQPEYLQALRLFVKEEQRHSRLLARFLALHGVPLLDRHWVDRMFRRIRGLAGPELRVRTLATAEILAMPYYAALREATASPLLRATCDRVLEEERAHLRFQSFSIGLFEGARSHLLRRLVWMANAVLLWGAKVVLWHEHGSVFRAAGFSRSRLHAEAARWFREWQRAGNPR